MTLATKVTAKIAASQSNALDLGDAAYPLTALATLNLADGTGANQANLLWSDRRTIVASGTDSLDLAGVLTDAFGATLTFARIKALMVVAAAANTNTIRVGGAASNTWATWVDAADNEVVVRPGGMLLLAATDATAYAVTAGTGDILEIANGGSGTSVTYDIVIVGASA